MNARILLVVASLVLSVITGVVLARGGGGGGGASSDAEHGKVRIGLSLDTLKEAREANLRVRCASLPEMQSEDDRTRDADGARGGS
jgi:hypothetical protein